jgi:hypothetical protein
MFTTITFAGMIGFAKSMSNSKQLLQITAPEQLLQISAPGIQLITTPIPLLQIESSKQLLITAPEYNVSVFSLEYDKGLRCLVLYIINPSLESHKLLYLVNSCEIVE